MWALVHSFSATFAATSFYWTVSLSVSQVHGTYMRACVRVTAGARHMFVAGLSGTVAMLLVECCISCGWVFLPIPQYEGMSEHRCSIL